MTSFDLHLLYIKRYDLKKDKDIQIEKIKEITQELTDIEEKIRNTEDRHGYNVTKRING